jgi:uncharacterized damage-inducible protein DinB
MQKDTFTLFAKYNKAVNEAMNGIIKTLTAEEWNKPLGGFFESVRGLCSHLYICDFNWLKRLSKLRDFTVFTDPGMSPKGESFFTREPYSFQEVLFPDMAEYLSKRPLLDSKILAFANELSDGDTNALLKYTDSEGKLYERNFGGLLMQCLNHDTHHRGMISLYLELLGRENDFSSFGQAYK